MTSLISKIKATPANRKELRAWAKFAIAEYSPLMGWLCVGSDGDVYSIFEPQGQSFLSDASRLIAQDGNFYKAHGEGGQYLDGERIKTQKAYLTHLLGKDEYDRIFATT